jgi:ribosomal-protein-alanine N-acetyltransferase
MKIGIIQLKTNILIVLNECGRSYDMRGHKMITPTLKTQRTILRPLKILDAENVFNNWATDPDVVKFLRWNLHQSVDATIEWLTSVENDIASDQCYDWGFELIETSELFGSGGLFYNDDENMFEIGFCIMKKHWSKGLTTEVAEAMVGFAINDLKENDLYARHAKENIASGRVLQKIGFLYGNDGEYSSFDGQRTFQSNDYYYKTNSS